MGGKSNVEATVKALDVFHQAGCSSPDPHPVGMGILSLVACSVLLLEAVRRGGVPCRVQQ